MDTQQAETPPEEPIIEYTVVEDEFSILDGVFDELFEQVEKIIRE